MERSQPATFHERSEASGNRDADANLLRARIKDLGLRIAGTALEGFVEKLYAELEAAGLSFRPPVYLSDEWGCPSEVPAIGVPFYLASPSLRDLEGKLGGGVETEREIAMYLRHEAGHAFNYAYKLYERSDWKATFGDYTVPYAEDYKPKPFSRKFVVHIPGWYAQKHPDEDFAESFALWLTPDSRWRERYRSWPALRKLLYVDAVAHELGRVPATVQVGEPDVEAAEMEATVGDYYRAREAEERLELDLGGTLDEELLQLFEPPARADLSASSVIVRHRPHLLQAITHYAGVSRPVAAMLVDHLRARAECLKLTAWKDDDEATVAKLAALTTSLAVTFLYTGRFIDPADLGGTSPAAPSTHAPSEP